MSLMSSANFFQYQYLQKLLQAHQKGLDPGQDRGSVSPEKKCLRRELLFGAFLTLCNDST